jgi:small subunit ribosomal protein S17
MKLQNEGAARSLRGVVTSDKCSKTRKVSVCWAIRHPLYGKVMQRKTIYHVHDPENSSHIGDLVEFRACRPVSQMKCWELLSVLEVSGEI